MVEGLTVTGFVVRTGVESRGAILEGVPPEGAGWGLTVTGVFAGETDEGPTLRGVAEGADGLAFEGSATRGLDRVAGSREGCDAGCVRGEEGAGAAGATRGAEG